MILFFYTLLMTILFPLFFLWHFWQRFLYGKFSRGFLERLGRIKMQSLEEGRIAIWVHAASVGEVAVAEPILSALHKKHSQIRFCLTTNTDTGYKVALEKMPFLESVFQAPLDFPFVIRRFLRRIQPQVMLIMETELWPNMLTAAAEIRLPVMIANGRISDRAFPRYQHLIWFFKPILSKIICFAMQSRLDADRIIEMGADPNAVVTVGNVKFDIVAEDKEFSELSRIILAMGWNDPSRVIIAGSTHSEEEPIVCEAFCKVRKSFPKVKLLLAPRHVHRIPEVIETLSRFRLSFRLRSRAGLVDHQPDQSNDQADVFVLDVIGELASAYTLGCVAFVGGSLQNIGGHNILEPAARSVPVLFGPFMANFKDSVRLILDHDAGRCVQDATELASSITELLRDPVAAAEMGQRGHDLVLKNRGAVRRHVALLEDLMGISSKSNNAAIHAIVSGEGRDG